MEMIEVTNKYADFITTPHDELGGRFYGTIETPYLYPSVTTVLNVLAPPEAVKNWWINTTKKVVDATMERTADIGIRLHSLIQEVTRGATPTFDAAYTPHLRSVTDWVKEKGVKSVAQEFVVVSEKYGFAGRVDDLLEVNGKLRLVDYKTGNKYKDSWGIQVAAYLLAFSEMSGISVDDLEMSVVQVARDSGQLKEFKFQHLDWMVDSWLLCLDLFKRAPRFSTLKKLGYKQLMEKAMVRAS